MRFQVALDDLGAGHSSLRHWAELRPDFVKLDRHFITGIDHDPDKREFLRSILDVSRSLGCQLIAEVIETAEEYRCLWELDRSLSLLQGYYFARPSLPGGDRVIVALGQLLEQQLGRSDFLGHIGGDDFMLLFAELNWESRCRAILAAFGEMSPGFYDAKDQEAGGVRVRNRQGQFSFFPFVSISLAARPISNGRGCDPLEIATELSELKHQAKQQPGNSLFIERRSVTGSITVR